MTRYISSFAGNLAMPHLGSKLEIPTPQYPYMHGGLTSYGPEVEACFFSPSDERQLELGGALLSSPTPSRQASPALDRRQRMQPLTSCSTISSNMSDRTTHPAGGEASSSEESGSQGDANTPFQAANSDAPITKRNTNTSLRRRVPEIDVDGEN